MKRIIATMLVCILLLPMLAGCCLSHDWQAATCQAPETCAKCGKIQGEILPHNWEKATCEKSETCTQCGATQGDPLGHEWQAATCETPETCATCGKTQGEALGHIIQPEIIEEGNLLVGTCTNCNTVVKEAFVWEELGDIFLLGDWWCAGYILPNGNISFAKEGDNIEFIAAVYGDTLDMVFNMRVLGQQISGNFRFSRRDKGVEHHHAVYDCEIYSDETGLVTYMEVWLLDDYPNEVYVFMDYAGATITCMYNRNTPSEIRIG